MNYVIQTAKVLKVEKVRVISDKFKVQTIVLETPDEKYPQKVSFQLMNENIDKISLREGDVVTDVRFDIRGREWTNKLGEVKYFNTLNIFSASVSMSEESPQSQSTNQNQNDSSDLPF